MVQYISFFWIYTKTNHSYFNPSQPIHPSRASPLLSAPGRTISSNTISTRGADPREAASRSAKVAQIDVGNIMQHRWLLKDGTKINLEGLP